MFHLDNNSGVSAMPPVGAVQSSAPRWYTEGGGGTPASYPGADWYNIIQAELLNLLSAYGINPNKSDFNQLQHAIEEAISQNATANSALLTAIAALVTSANKMPYFTGKDKVAMTDLTAFARTLLGRSDAAGVLSVLGLGAGSPAVGIPFFWPHTQMPNNLVDDWNQMTFLKMNGSSFTATAYPILAKIWPGLTLPDFRGEFVRIWDDGRGVDSGRNLLTAQSFAMQNITGSFGEIADESKRYAVEINAASGAFQTQTYMRNIMRNPDFVARNAAVSITFDASRVAQTAAETRPRNISIGFIVRAK
ncbi:TPA: phage tail protein [Enterobacter asburiae]